MENEPAHSSDVAFTPAVKAVQNRRGSRRAYARQEEGGGWATVIDAGSEAFHRGADERVPGYRK